MLLCTLQLLEKVRGFCLEKTVKNVVVVKMLVQMLLNLTVRCKAESHLLINLSKQLQEDIGVLPEMVSIK